ncbi:hypothetical protein AAMO2058_001388000 [Amorphochlora amoebiformis]
MELSYSDIKNAIHRLILSEGFGSLTLKEVRKKLEVRLGEERLRGKDEDIQKCTEEVLLDLFSLLPKVNEVLGDILKIKEGTSGKPIETLINALSLCQSLIKTLPTVDVSMEEQMKLKANLNNILKKRRALVAKFAQGSDGQDEKI